jgi:hypothetical protein
MADPIGMLPRLPCVKDTLTPLLCCFFEAQIKDFDVGNLVDKKNARRYDDCLSYTMVASKKVRRWRDRAQPSLGRRCHASELMWPPLKLQLKA